MRRCQAAWHQRRQHHAAGVYHGRDTCIQHIKAKKKPTPAPVWQMLGTLRNAEGCGRTDVGAGAHIWRWPTCGERRHGGGIVVHIWV